MSENGQLPSDEENRAFASAATAVPSLLLSGMLVYGGAGWALDQWLHVPALFPAGVVVGLVFAIILVYVRYGR